MKESRLTPWLVLSLLALVASPALATVVTTTPYDGITYIVRTETSPRAETMHIVKVDLTNPNIRFQVTPAGSGIPGTRDTVRQTTLDYLNQSQAVVAMNSHFFVPYPSSDTTANVVGLAASNGNVYSSFEPQPVPGETGFPTQNYAIVPFAPALNIDANNIASIVHWDSSYSDNKHVLENVSLYNALSGSAQIVTNGVNTVPLYKDATHPDGLLTPNGTYSNSYSWYSLPNARTVIGLTQDSKTLVMFTVDKAGGSQGMTPGEIANLLISDYGVYSALNLDGGGSTTMAMRDPNTGIGSIMNVSADNPLGRAVGSNLAVIVVPEPATMSLILVGLGGMILRRRK